MMMNTEAKDDVESQVEPQLNDSDLPATNVRSHAKSQWKKFAIGTVLIVAIVVVIAIPVAVTANSKEGSSSSLPSQVEEFSDPKQEAFNPAIEKEPTLESVNENRPLNEVAQNIIDSANSALEEQTEEEGVSPTTTEEQVEDESESAAEAQQQYDNSEPEPPASAEVTTTTSIVTTQTVCPALDVTATARSSVSAQWTQMADDIFGESARDSSGLSLDMSADGLIVAIGTSYNDGTAGQSSGHVRAYKYNNDHGNYTQLGQDVDGESERDWFGSSLALDASGLRLAAGAIFSDDGPFLNTGHVKVFDFDESKDEWTQVGNTILGQAQGDQLGASVSLSADGTRLAVGASHADGFGNATDVGHVYVFELADNIWQPIGLIVGDGDEDLAGRTISLSADGSHVAIGASRHDHSDGTPDVGRVRIYQDNRFAGVNEWLQLGGEITSTRRNQQVGSSIAMSDDGSRVAVGFPEVSLSSFPFPGATRIFQYKKTENAWVQLGNDLVGSHSVSMAQTGRVAVGDYTNYRNGMDSGTVRMYDLNAETNVWDIVGQEIHGKSNEMSGIATVLSADGSRVAITAPRASSGDSRQVGATRLFDLC